MWHNTSTHTPCELDDQVSFFYKGVTVTATVCGAQCGLESLEENLHTKEKKSQALHLDVNKRGNL